MSVSPRDYVAGAADPAHRQEGRQARLGRWFLDEAVPQWARANGAGHVLGIEDGGAVVGEDAVAGMVVGRDRSCDRRRVELSDLLGDRGPEQAASEMEAVVHTRDRRDEVIGEKIVQGTITQCLDAVLGLAPNGPRCRSSWTRGDPVGEVDDYTHGHLVPDHQSDPRNGHIDGNPLRQRHERCATIDATYRRMNRDAAALVFSASG